MDQQEVTPIIREYGTVAREKRITTILLHPFAVHLNPTDRRVLRKIASYERRLDGCRLRQTQIAKQVGLGSREQVNRILGKLDRLGFILREQERRANGSLSTCKITLNDALIRQVLGLEPIEKCHTVTSHGMSHGMSHLEEGLRPSDRKEALQPPGRSESQDSRLGRGTNPLPGEVDPHQEDGSSAFDPFGVKEAEAYQANSVENLSVLSLEDGRVNTEALPWDESPLGEDPSEVPQFVLELRAQEAEKKRAHIETLAEAGGS